MRPIRYRSQVPSQNLGSPMWLRWLLGGVIVAVMGMWLYMVLSLYGLFDGLNRLVESWS
jgi:hypothetical protein